MPVIPAWTEGSLQAQGQLGLQSNTLFQKKKNRIKHMGTGAHLENRYRKSLLLALKWGAQEFTALLSPALPM